MMKENERKYIVEVESRYTASRMTSSLGKGTSQTARARSQPCCARVSYAGEVSTQCLYLKMRGPA